MKKYWQTRNKFLAYGLSYVGYAFYKFEDEKGDTYSFEETTEFLHVVKELSKIKSKYYYDKK